MEIERLKKDYYQFKQRTIDSHNQLRENLLVLQEIVSKFAYSVEMMREEFKEEMKRMREEFHAEMRERDERFRREMEERDKRFEEEMRMMREEFRAEMRERDERFRKEMEEKDKRFEQWKQEMNKKWGELSERLGTLTENIFAPGIPYLAERLGYTVKKRMLNVEYKRNGMSNQYDAIVIVEDKKGRELVFVVEVKSQVRAEDFNKFKKKLENLLKYEPSYKGKIVPVLTGLKGLEDVLNLAKKRKVLLVRMGGDYLEALNPEILESF